MKTLDEVIKAYEYCNHDDRCEDCPYNGIACTLERDTDALHYLKTIETTENLYHDAVNELSKWKDEDWKDRYLPLTWDELHIMEGRPVWLESHGDITEFTGWAIVKNIKPDDRVNFILSRCEDDGFCALEIGVLKALMGRDWKAYRKERT